MEKKVEEKRIRKKRLIITIILISLIITAISIGIWQGFVISNNQNLQLNECSRLHIRMKSDDDALLYVNGSMVLNATDPTKTHEYNTSCVLNGGYLIAVQSKGFIKPNGFIGSIFYGNTEISYTGDGKWLGVDGDAIGDWKSNFGYDDSDWVPMDEVVTSTCDSSPLSTGISSSRSKYVNLPDCWTANTFISLRLKLTFINGVPSVTVPFQSTNECQSLIIRTKFDDFGDVYINGKFIYKANDYARPYRYSIPCASGQYLIAILATGLGYPGGFNGYGLSVSLGNTEIAYTGDGKFKGIIDNATGDWISNPNYDESNWTNLDSVIASICNSYPTYISNSSGIYVGLPDCYTPWMINSVRLKITV